MIVTANEVTPGDHVRLEDGDRRVEKVEQVEVSGDDAPPMTLLVFGLSDLVSGKRVRSRSFRWTDTITLLPRTQEERDAD